MMSLMSMFDPHSGIMFNWLTIFSFFFFMLSMKWFTHSNFYNILSELSNLIIATVKHSLKNFTILFFFCIFLFILMSNMFGMVPYSFSMSSHFSYNFSLGFFLWLVGLWYSLFSKMMEFIAHLTPQGCPMLLVPIMVIIEFVSIIIRPIAISNNLNMTWVEFNNTSNQ
uniref:ATP synthase subunit a n=1 Tax=Macrogyropus costalimai TaxID=1941320 RepID=A0A7S6BFL1_9NEOP|nr:ATP synthase F0 subunit 6 [Macrogyropus costalimai]